MEILLTDYVTYLFLYIFRFHIVGNILTLIRNCIIAKGEVLLIRFDNFKFI